MTERRKNTGGYLTTMRRFRDVEDLAYPCREVTLRFTTYALAAKSVEAYCAARNFEPIRVYPYKETRGTTVWFTRHWAYLVVIDGTHHTVASIIHEHDMEFTDKVVDFDNPWD